MSAFLPGSAGRIVDGLDRRIVELLELDGRLSVNELAKRAGISRANAYQRLGRLLSEGVITGFSARVDPRRLGLDVSALVIVSAEQRSWRELLAELRELPSVEWIALTAGSFDFVLLVRVPDVETLRDVVLESIQTIAGVRSTETMFILEELDPRSQAPGEAAPGDRASRAGPAAPGDRACRAGPAPGRRRAGAG